MAATILTKTESGQQIGKVIEYDGTRLGVKIEVENVGRSWFYTNEYKQATGQDTPIVGTKVVITPGHGCLVQGTVHGLYQDEAAADKIMDPMIAEVYKIDDEGDPHFRFPNGDTDYSFADTWEADFGVAPAVGQRVRCEEVSGGCGVGLNPVELVS